MKFDWVDIFCIVIFSVNIVLGFLGMITSIAAGIGWLVALGYLLFSMWLKNKLFECYKNN